MRVPVSPGETAALLDHRTVAVDGVVVATPASQAAVLLESPAPVAAGILATIGFASVAVVTLSFDPGAVRSRLWGTGFVVPRTTAIDGRTPLVTACTYLSGAWPHLDGAGDVLLRVTVGRAGDTRHQHLDDAELTAAVVRELGTVLDLGAPPISSTVARWPDALPQYDVGHLVLVALAEKAVREHPGIALCGASYRGVSIPACIAGGRAAAGEVVRSFDRPGPVTGPGGPAGGAPGTDPPPAPGAVPAGMVVRRDRTYRVPRRGAVAGPAVASGLGLALSLPPWGWWILAFPAAGLLFWRLGGLRPRTRLWAGFLAGLGLYVPGLAWVRSFSPPGAVVLIAVEALFPAVACLAVPSRRDRRQGPGLPGRHDRDRGRADDLAVRRAAARRRLPRPGGGAGARRGPPRRSAAAHRVGVRRRRGPGHARRGRGAGGPGPPGGGRARAGR